jgi:hypothetical protein
VNLLKEMPRQWFRPREWLRQFQFDVLQSVAPSVVPSREPQELGQLYTTLIRQSLPNVLELATDATFTQALVDWRVGIDLVKRIASGAFADLKDRRELAKLARACTLEVWARSAMEYLGTVKMNKEEHRDDVGGDSSANETSFERPQLRYVGNLSEMLAEGGTGTDDLFEAGTGNLGG